MAGSSSAVPSRARSSSASARGESSPSAISSAGAPSTVIGRACTNQVVVPSQAHSTSWGVPNRSSTCRNAASRGSIADGLGTGDELASMVIECLTNSYMNAEVIRVDGGIRMPPK